MNNYFIGIGVAKAGTSWLGEYLKAHPEICFSPIKEVHYFDCKFLSFVKEIKLKRLKHFRKVASKVDRNVTKNIIFNLKQHLFLIEMFSDSSAYHKYFDWLKQADEKICGEITPEYSLLDLDGLMYLKAFLNSPKIVLMLRNPVERQWSQVRFHKKFIPNLVFEDYFLKSFNLKRFVEWSSYQDLLPKLFSVFKKEEIHIIFYEDLFNNSKQNEILKNLCHFLGVSYKQANFEKKINPSTQNNLEENLRLIGIDRLKHSYKYIYNNFNDIPNNWIEDLKSINVI